MVDQEVTRILAEIRDKVRANNNAGPNSLDTRSSQYPTQQLTIESVETNGFAGLTVLSRAWDRLPPLVTRRTGTMARLDLWLKSKLKGALRWITWEQVNFNAATHQTFIEVIDSLQQQKSYLGKLQDQMMSEFQATRDKLDIYQQEHRHELETQRTEFLEAIRSRQDQVERQHSAFTAQLASFNAFLSDLRARIDSVDEQSNSLKVIQLNHDEQFKGIEERFTQLITEFHQLVDEARRRDEEQILNEQRVCYKQLSLQLSETQVLNDRARRELEMRIQKLEALDKNSPTT